MSIYLVDDRIVLDSAAVATSSDCCCGGVCCDCDDFCNDATTQEDCEAAGGSWKPSVTCADEVDPCGDPVKGACCNGIECSIKTQSCCEVDDGVYQGDGTECDPNPCTTPNCPCYFTNPDDGLAYLTRVSNYTDTVDCPPSETWLVFADGSYVDSSCNPTPWLAPALYQSGTTTVHILNTETYDADCNLIESFTDPSVEAYCRCFDDNPRPAVPGCGGFVIKPRSAPEISCDTYCADPSHFVACEFLVFDHYTYEDPCIPI